MARLGVVVAGVGLLLAGMAGASSAELPRGWWKGRDMTHSPGG